MEQEISKLTEVFGVGGAFRILRKNYQIDLKDFFHLLASSKMRFSKTLTNWVISKNFVSPGSFLSIETLIQKLRGVQLFQEGSELHLETVSDEITRILYAYLVQDDRMLNVVVAESKNPENGEFLCECFRRAAVYYQRLVEYEPKGISRSTRLKFYQKAGVRFILDHKKVILADEPGLGKTLQALVAAMNAYDGKGAQKVLIICPSVSKTAVWERQIKEHLRGEQEACVILERKDFRKIKKGKMLRKVRFVIVNYEILLGTEEGARKFVDELKRMNFDFIIYDEIHRIRSHYTQTHQVIQEFSALFEVGITGTPLVGRKIRKLFNVLHKFHPEAFSDPKEFYRKYRQDPMAIQHLQKEVLLRRYSMDVLPDLPPFNLEVRKLTMHPKHAEVYRAFEKRILESPSVDILSQLHQLIKAATDFSLLAKSSGPIFSIPSVKYEELDKIVKKTLSDKKEKCVVFTGRVSIVDQLKQRYESKGVRVLVLHGETKAGERKKILQEFNQSEIPTLLVTTYHVGGESIDLYGATTGVVIDLPWTAQAREQIFRRLYRVGQKKPVYFIILQCKGTIDEHVEAVNIESDILQKVLFEDPTIQFDPEKEIIQRLKTAKIQKKQPLEPRFGLASRMGAPHFDKPLESVEKEGERICFKGGKLEVQLGDTNGKVFNASGFLSLLTRASTLNTQSKAFLRDFWEQRFLSEEDQAVPVKERILWGVASEIVPGFEWIDYDGKMEQTIEVASMLLRRLIQDPTTSLKQMSEEFSGVPDFLLDKTAQFLDESNLLKFFSTLEVIAPHYYIKGELLRRTSPIHLYYDLTGIHYHDPSVVEAIVPQDKRGEDLTREEEIRLARQVELGNRAAEPVLLQAHEKRLPPVVGAVLHFFWTIGMGEKVKKEELLETAKVLLWQDIRQYAYKGVYEEKTLDSYLRGKLFGQLVGSELKRFKESAKEKTYDPEGWERLGTNLIEGKESLHSQADFARTLRKFDLFLKKLGFNPKEQKVLLQHILRGVSPKEIAIRLQMDISDVKEVIQRFKEKVTSLGEGIVSRLLSGEPLDSSSRNLPLLEQAV